MWIALGIVIPLLMIQKTKKSKEKKKLDMWMCNFLLTRKKKEESIWKEGMSKEQMINRIMEELD